jgi:hypothetical protein
VTKGRIALLAVAMAAVVLLVWALVPRLDAGSADDDGGGDVVTVDAAGGTFEFAGGLVVDVPAGAVDRTLELRVTEPIGLASEDGRPFSGLRSAGARFDVSLGGHEVCGQLPPTVRALPANC